MVSAEVEILAEGEMWRNDSIESWLGEMGDWLFGETTAKLVELTPSEISDEVMSSAVLEVVFGDWPGAGVRGPVVGLECPNELLRVAALGSRCGRAPDWRCWGVHEIVGAEGRAAGFGERWLVEFARRVAPGRVMWTCREGCRRWVEARVRRVATMEGKRGAVRVIRAGDGEQRSVEPRRRYEAACVEE